MFGVCDGMFLVVVAMGAIRSCGCASRCRSEASVLVASVRRR